MTIKRSITQLGNPVSDGVRYTLDDLRTGVLAEGERQLLGDLWAQVEQTLGWRPAPGPKKRRK